MSADPTSPGSDEGPTGEPLVPSVPAPSGHPAPASPGPSHDIGPGPAHGTLAGLAIGAAWSGLLSNFAAGAFLVVLRPFTVGDHVTTAGVTGTIVEVGLFTTTLLTQDNVRTFIGNSKVLGSILRNYHANPTRRIELIGTAHRHADLPALLAACKEALAATPGVLATPAPEVELLSFDATHLKLAIRPYTHPDSYWATLFAATTALLPHLDSLSPTRAAAELEEEDFEADEGAGESEEE